MSRDCHRRAEPQEVASIGLLILAAVWDDSDTADRQHGLWRTRQLRIHYEEPSAAAPQPPSLVWPGPSVHMWSPTRMPQFFWPCQSHSSADMRCLFQSPCLLRCSLHGEALVGSGSQQTYCELLLHQHPNLNTASTGPDNFSEEFQTPEGETA